jgi:hypothetical protein
MKPSMIVLPQASHGRFKRFAGCGVDLPEILSGNHYA